MADLTLADLVGIGIGWRFKGGMDELSDFVINTGDGTGLRAIEVNFDEFAFIARSIGVRVSDDDNALWFCGATLIRCPRGYNFT